MKIQCDYCDNTYEDTLYNCPHCGARNPSHNDGDVRPRTIEELKKWYSDHNLPPYETTRFFIGINYKGPKAFGIYKDGNKFVVYKNKADGSRAIRYEGEDEQYAVHELWQRLKDEIVNQKNNQKNTAKTGLYAGACAKQSYKYYIGAHKTTPFTFYAFIMSVFIGFLIFAIGIQIIGAPKMGYYSYDNDTYFEDSNGAWYSYDDNTDTWSSISQYSLPAELQNSDTVKDYYVSSEWNNYYCTTDWYDTTFYSDYQERCENDSSSSSDSYSWDSSDSWDSGSTDWDSDW